MLRRVLGVSRGINQNPQRLVSWEGKYNMHEPLPTFMLGGGKPLPWICQRYLSISPNVTYSLSSDCGCNSLFILLSARNRLITFPRNVNVFQHFRATLHPAPVKSCAHCRFTGFVLFPINKIQEILGWIGDLFAKWIEKNEAYKQDTSKEVYSCSFEDRRPCFHFLCETRLKTFNRKNECILIFSSNSQLESKLVFHKGLGYSVGLFRYLNRFTIIFWSLSFSSGLSESDVFTPTGTFPGHSVASGQSNWRPDETMIPLCKAIFWVG